MTKSKGNKTIVLAIGLLLILSLSTFAAIVPLASAHSPAWQIPTYAYVAASPNTIGVGQTTAIIMWLDKYPPTAGGLGGDLWQGFKLEITKPDGSKETKGPFTSSTIASNWLTYTPTQVGDYKFVFSWPGQTLTV